MPTIEVNDEQILRALDRLSPAGRREALRKLLGGLERLDRLVETNRGKLEALSLAKGREFSRLTEEERAALIDEFLHERA